MVFFMTRDANLGDLDFIQTLSENAFADRGSYGRIIRYLVQRGLNKPTYNKTVVEAIIDDSQQLGFGIIEFRAERESYIPAIAVNPESYRSGIGRRLLTRLVELSRERDDSRVTLHVARDSPAHDMFAKFGFKQLPGGGFKYPTGVEAIKMSLDLELPPLLL